MAKYGHQETPRCCKNTEANPKDCVRLSRYVVQVRAAHDEPKTERGKRKLQSTLFSEERKWNPLRLSGANPDGVKGNENEGQGRQEKEGREHQSDVRVHRSQIVIQGQNKDT